MSFFVFALSKSVCLGPAQFFCAQYVCVRCYVCPTSISPFSFVRPLYPERRDAVEVERETKRTRSLSALVYGAERSSKRERVSTEEATFFFKSIKSHKEREKNPFVAQCIWKTKERELSLDNDEWQNGVTLTDCSRKDAQRQRIPHPDAPQVQLIFQPFFTMIYEKVWRSIESPSCTWSRRSQRRSQLGKDQVFIFWCLNDL